MSNPYVIVSQMKKMLVNLDGWLEKAAAFADQKKFDKNLLMSARLAPDAYPLVRQIQAAADGLKFTSARLAGKDAPAHPDTETTYDEARERIRKSIAFFDTLAEKDFEGWESRKITLGFIPGDKNAMAAQDYVFELQIPNFFFHVTTAYQILRHNGVPLGKMDFIGSLNLTTK